VDIEDDSPESDPKHNDSKEGGWTERPYDRQRNWGERQGAGGRDIQRDNSKRWAGRGSRAGGEGYKPGKGDGRAERFKADPEHNGRRMKMRK
jgi:hypothetical protein